MSAVFGVWRLDGSRVDPGAISGMSRRLAHRGSGSEWIRVEGSVGIGGRTRTTGGVAEESRGTRTLLLVADARIDNRRELATALGLDAADEEVSDAALLLASYRAWSTRCAERWIGDFAVAIWDGAERRLFCARDPFGVRALHYHHAPGRLFAFASEIEALLAVEGVPDEIDEVELARHLLVPVGIDRASTYRAHIRRVEPGHALVVSERGAEARAHWRLDPSKELRLSSDDAYAEALRESFVEAVRCRMRGADSVACMLSGGIDSASIACVAARLREQTGQPSALHSLSAVYPSVPESDERRSIEQVLERYPMTPHFFAADAHNPIADIDRVNDLLGGAAWGGNLYLNWILYGVAAEAGARVVLDGFDGDSTVSHGLGYLSELSRTGRWWKLARTSVPYSRRHGRPALADYGRLVETGIRHPASGSTLGRLTAPLRSMRAGTRRHRAVNVNRYSILAADFARRFEGLEPDDPDLPVTEREFHERKLKNSVLFETIGWLDACAAGQGVELGLPFCDVRLVELCLSFPPEQKLWRGWTRHAMRRAMQGILPPEIQWRQTKTELHAGWIHAVLSMENGRIERVLSNPNPAVRDYLDAEAVRRLYGRWRVGGMPADEERALWRAVSLALWLSPGS